MFVETDYQSKLKELKKKDEPSTVKNREHYYYSLFRRKCSVKMNIGQNCLDVLLKTWIKS